MFPNPARRDNLDDVNIASSFPKPFACGQPNCNKTYTSKSHLDRHVCSVHLPPTTEIIYSCSRCNKPFANRQNLKRHINNVHHNVYTCDICNKHFKRKTQLGAHMFEHTGIKGFSCDVCSETFISVYQKRRHLRYHKSYSCDDCFLIFNHWSTYAEHKRTYHEKNEYICDECGKYFTRRTHILRHLKIHTQEHISRTFPCPYANCERFYSRNSNLKQHIQVKHMNIFFVCIICNAQLSTKAKLNYHLQLHYNATQPKLCVENTERKQRKDEGTFKSSAALKLAGLSKVPDESSQQSVPLDLMMKSELIEVDCDVIV